MHPRGRKTIELRYSNLVTPHLSFPPSSINNFVVKTQKNQPPPHTRARGKRESNELKNTCFRRSSDDDEFEDIERLPRGTNSPTESEDQGLQNFGNFMNQDSSGPSVTCQSVLDYKIVKRFKQKKKSPVKSYSILVCKLSM